MTRDRSLDEFLGADGEDEGDRDGETDDEFLGADGEDGDDGDGETDDAGETPDGAGRAESDDRAADEDGSTDATGATPTDTTGATPTDTTGATPTDEAAVSADDAASETGVKTEPARVTYEWSPDGGPCGRCGETVHRRWRTDPDPGEEPMAVCVDCKNW